LLFSSGEDDNFSDEEPLFEEASENYNENEDGKTTKRENEIQKDKKTKKSEIMFIPQASRTNVAIKFKEFVQIEIKASNKEDDSIGAPSNNTSLEVGSKKNLLYG